MRAFATRRKLAPIAPAPAQAGGPRTFQAGAGSGHRPETAVMSGGDRKSIYWTGALVGAIIAVIAILWATGVFQAGTTPAS